MRLAASPPAVSLTAAGALTGAHPTLPFGTRVSIENLGNGKSAVVRINDRAPFVNGRIIDVSRAAAEQLGLIHGGSLA
jgi:rare lipoprotein A